MDASFWNTSNLFVSNVQTEPKWENIQIALSLGKTCEKECKVWDHKAHRQHMHILEQGQPYHLFIMLTGEWAERVRVFDSNIKSK